ncbi:InlB B-repeat-containing protein [Bifidobacterium cuniculi]|uniref:Leucine-rich repeat (LRR) protein n=1 Tax=Bifidobacterium cuniculi TaxID=1688 RepID=A0A087AFG0_9BIFI|nr:InlB B-repeat-containing protein [Bifidobacterium cuniculi]KFI57510.1 leucine-rich repeat (LRR) protein [Bifidobacterium cuniculi]
MVDVYGNAVGNWRAKLYAAVKASDGYSYTLVATTSIQSINGYWYSGLNVTGTATVNGQSASVTRTGVSLSQNATVGLVTKELRISRTHSPQTVTLRGVAAVSGYAAGTSTASTTITIPALAAHTVKYNANGGSGAPGNQTKWYGTALTLSTVRPTRVGYAFQGWATSASGAVAYQPGGRYGADQNVTLYAVWKRNAAAPTISSFTAQRCTADGTPDDEGTWVKLSCAWRVDTTNDASNAFQSMVFAWQNQGNKNQYEDLTASVSTSDGVSTSIVGPYSADVKCSFRATLKDKYATATALTSVAPAQYVFDISADGRGIGIGMAAPEDGVNIYGSTVKINNQPMPLIFKGSITVSPTGSSTRHTLFSEAQWAEITSNKINDGHAVVIVSNGDVDARNISLTGTGFSEKDKRWYVYCSEAVSAIFRVNYMIFI